MKPLPDGDHVARYCKPSTVDERGYPLANAFALRAGEDHLSVNWLEYFDPHPEVAIHQVRETLRAKGFELRPNGRFALLDVAAVKTTVKRSLGLRLHVNHLPHEHDPSHAGVLAYTDADLMVAVEIRALVGPTTCAVPYDGRSLLRGRIRRRAITNKTALIAVVVAFLTGVLATLAIRPPGEGSAVTASRDGQVQVAVRWRVPVAFATTLEVLGDNIVWVTDAIRSSSDGAMVLEPFEPGEVVPPLNIVDAVREGKVQAGYTWLGYDQGKIPASPLLGAVPFGMEPWEYTAWWYEAGGRELAEALYAKYDVHPLLCGLIGPETAGWFRSPIDSLDDLEGLKIRFAGLGGKVIERLGASVTMLPGGEIFQALEKGAIDATEFSLPNVDEQLGFDRIAKLNYYPGWHQPYTAAHLVVNIEEWQALAPAEQAIIDTACTAGVTRNLANSEEKQGPILAGFPDKGVTPIVLPEAILRQLNDVADEVMAEEAANDEDFRIIHESQVAFRKQYAQWKRFAYLPRDF